MHTQNLELWRVRLDTEQAQIDAMARRIVAHSISEFAYLKVEHIKALKRNHAIMVRMRELLRDELGRLGLLSAIEGQ